MTDSGTFLPVALIAVKDAFWSRASVARLDIAKKLPLTL